jgi:hypothetical protein
MTRLAPGAAKLRAPPASSNAGAAASKVRLFTDRPSHPIDIRFYASLARRADHILDDADKELCFAAAMTALAQQFRVETRRMRRT